MNVKLGKYNQLEVVKEVDFGVYLDGGDDGEILLPTRYVPEGCKPGDVLNVFLYLDNEERLIATTLQPLVQVDEFACLEVAWVNAVSYTHLDVYKRQVLGAVGCQGSFAVRTYHIFNASHQPMVFPYV